MRGEIGAGVVVGRRGGRAVRAEPELVGDGTKAQIFAEILSSGPLSRTEVARRLSLSQSTVTKIVNPLLELGYLVEAGERSSGNGRPQRLVRVARDMHNAIGVKLAPAHVTAVLTDLEAGVLSRMRVSMPPGYSPDYALDTAAAVVDELLEAAPGARERLLGVGVGLGGHVDSRSGRCVYSGVLGWRDVDLAGRLAELVGLPVFADNDVNALVIAERWFGEGRDSDSFAVVTVGAGIGCGLVLRGEPYVGVAGLGGELGHVPVQPDGALCSCGSRGCLETVASDVAVMRQIAASGLDCASVEEAVALAREGEPAAVAAFASMGEALGRGLAVLCNLLNLDKIVVTGERAGAYDLFGPACEASLAAHGFSSAARDCSLIVDVADDYLWARGAACLVIRNAVYVSR
ncbi:MAG TPA: ROK family transcriptional regulator [Thermomonospora sp.]|nr:ROK family transcriptional regulator [Thermomonospora sp.]